ncbi:MAG: Phosphoribosyl-AMP cyclohydrolase [Actinobacteria bacterium]|nr:Phosphoribosyl-AMP cyclohydrolase [Actinomycetota bacterium]
MTEIDISQLKFDRDGLIPAIVQDFRSREVLMLAYMSRESLQKTLETGRTWFYSRSRERLWMKGESSGNYQLVKDMRYDCDADCLLVLVEQVGVACHTGERSCFFSSLTGRGMVKTPGIGSEAEEAEGLDHVLKELFRVIKSRKKFSPQTSYTASLFKAGASKILAKVTEESGEVVEAAREGSRENLIHEIADVIYHLLVLTAFKDIELEDIARELIRRRK